MNDDRHPEGSGILIAFLVGIVFWFLVWVAYRSF